MVRILELFLIATALIGLTFTNTKSFTTTTKNSKPPAFEYTLPTKLNLTNDDRTILMNGPVTEEMADDISKQIYDLDKENHKPITIQINSEGGVIYFGLEIYDAMQAVKSPIHTECVGICMSMASVILAGGEPGYRTALPHATILIHTAAGKMEGHVADIKNEYDELVRLNNLVYDIFVKTTKMSHDEVVKESDHDHYISPEDGVRLGLIDRIESPAKK